MGVNVRRGALVGVGVTEGVSTAVAVGVQTVVLVGVKAAEGEAEAPVVAVGVCVGARECWGVLEGVADGAVGAAEGENVRVAYVRAALGVGVAEAETSEVSDAVGV